MYSTLDKGEKGKDMLKNSSKGKVDSHFLANWHRTTFAEASASLDKKKVEKKKINKYFMKLRWL